LILLLPFSASAASQFVTVQSKKIIAPGGSELHLKVIGLGNWLVQEAYMFKFEGDVHASPREIHELVNELIGPEAARNFSRKFIDRYAAKADIEFLKKAGFNSVRVLFNYRVLTPEGSPAKWTERGFEPLEHVIEWSRAAGLYVILDMHCAPGGETGANIDDSWGYPWLYESPAGQKSVADVWHKIAERHKDEPTVMDYDLMNEPLPSWPELRRYDSVLEPVLKRITAAIREVDQNHIIILEVPPCYSTLSAFGPPFDAKCVYSFHK
jgi:endoglucanase